MPIVVPLETVTVLRLLHPENALLSPIEVTLAGMVMLERQNREALNSMKLKK